MRHLPPVAFAISIVALALSILALVLSLSGCGAFVQGFKEGVQKVKREGEQQDRAKAQALQPGSSQAQVIDAWGLPSGTAVLSAGNSGLIEQWRYHSCSVTAGYRINVLFVTFVDGSVTRWSMIPC